MPRLFLIFILLLGSLGQAQAEVEFSPRTETVFPFFMGGAAELHVDRQFQIGIGLGFAPAPYVASIGEVAAQYGDNPAYSDVIQDSFEDNFIFRLSSRYGFSKEKNHWFLAGGYSYVSTRGVSEINSVLAAATGRDFSLLTNLLQAAGRSTEVNLEGSVSIVDLALGYNFSLHENVNFQLSLGVGKIIDAQTEISTGLPSFEASTVGQNLLDQTENDIESIILEYGLSPIVGLAFNFYF